MDAIYVSNNSFRVIGDESANFSVGRRVKLDCGLDGVKYAAVTSSSYFSPYTTVVIDESDLTASLTAVWYGVISLGATGSFPDHTHDGSEGSGGTIASTGVTEFTSLFDTPTSYSGAGGLFLRVEATESGIEWAAIDIPTFSGLEDTPAVYDDGYYLRMTASGITTVSGIILEAPNGSEWLLQVTNSGTLYTTEVI